VYAVLPHPRRGARPGLFSMRSSRHHCAKASLLLQVRMFLGSELLILHALGWQDDLSSDTQENFQHSIWKLLSSEL